MIEIPPSRSVVTNPTHEQMRSWALELTPRVSLTEFDNLNYQSEVTARLSRSTFFVADEDIHQNRISRDEADEWARRQDEYLVDRDMIAVEGYIGPDPAFRTGTRMVIERSQANIAGMQDHLYFPADDDWEPEFTVIYTPGLPAPGKPDDRLIIVDLNSWTTRVFGSDYFGESKMGGLRMWNRLVYDKGGLALHAGLKTFPAEATADGEEHSMLIIGLSGTGKTTTTFRRQLDSLPVQDDFVALMPGGVVHTTENGCFAKTYGLDPDDEPTIFGGATRPDAWLENVAVAPDGKVDFFDASYTANGRCTFPLANIQHRSPLGVPPAHYLLILNRSDHVIPAVARLQPDQVAAYFMLGETKGTSAGGAAEAGKSLRVPGTNPFFFNDDALQGNRLLELLETMPDLQVYLLNTGQVGAAGDGDDRGKKVRIPDSSAIVAGIVSDTIEWDTDPDFGYQVATSVPGVDDPELLQPRRLYARQSRLDEYAAMVDRLQAERGEYLAGYAALDPRIQNGL
ncbi:MAG TPA: phosphoenolpyruvate carboxykinase [Acidimicrobiia bacterium]|nr:phosphoenolpyruvate carboxykinase [Acidimicrobiia bacterium]